MLAAVFERRLLASASSSTRLLPRARHYTTESESGPSTHAESSASSSSSSPSAPSSSDPTSASTPHLAEEDLAFASAFGGPSSTRDLAAPTAPQEEDLALASAFERLFPKTASSRPSPLNDDDVLGMGTPAEPSKYKANKPIVDSQEPDDRAQVVEELWNRVLQTPHAVLGAAPQIGKRFESLLDNSTPMRQRNLRGTRLAQYRSKGQTPSEARQMNESLLSLFKHLESRTVSPAGRASRAGRLDQLLGTGAGSTSGSRMAAARQAAEDPETMQKVDALTEELSGLLTPPEVIAFVEEHLFVREPSKTPGGSPEFPKTYPHMLAEVMRHLHVTLNSPHLALAMFEHARTLSVDSFLAGCNTRAYNEIIATRWHSFRDLRGVVDAANEMKQTNVRWDRRTAQTIDNVAKAVLNDVKMGRGAQRWGADVGELLDVLDGYMHQDNVKQDAQYKRAVNQKRKERMLDRLDVNAGQRTGGSSGSHFDRSLDRGRGDIHFSNNRGGDSRFGNNNRGGDGYGGRRDRESFGSNRRDDRDGPSRSGDRHRDLRGDRRREHGDSYIRHRAEPPSRSHFGGLAEHVAEPHAESTPDPRAETLAEPIAEPIAEPPMPKYKPGPGGRFGLRVPSKASEDA